MENNLFFPVVVRHLGIVWLLIWLLKRGFRSVAQQTSCSLDLGKEMRKTVFWL